MKIKIIPININIIKTLLPLLLLLLPTIICQFDLQDYGLIINNKHKSKFLWGTYKPNLYFALKNRRNTSDVFGLMWYGSESSDLKSSGDLDKRLRHNCRMEDNINYRWESHNGVDFGSEVIEDTVNNLRLTTKFVKREYNTTDNQIWDVVIKGELQNKKKVAVMLYTSMENFDVADKAYFTVNGNFMNLIKNESMPSESSLEFTGLEKGKEKYTYNLSFGKNTKLLSKSYQKYRKIYNETWRVKKFVVDELKIEEENMRNKNETWDYITLNPIKSKNILTPNVVVIQLIFDSDFEIYVNFKSTVEGAGDGKKNNEKISTADEIDNLLIQKELEFTKRFDEIYWSRLSSENFTPLNLDTNSNVEEKMTMTLLKEMCKSALSNILGGIGYFFGKIKINLDKNLPEGQYHKGFRYAVENKGLFTGTPSRSNFARGFLWDEGFHNIIISQWDVDISVDIIDSWLSTMSATGWMAREQIRGAEAESQVPAKFIIQDKLVANPPTFIFPLENILNYYKFFNEEKNLKNLNSFLKKCFDKFGSWYEWFETYQKSTDRKSYQWQGRNSEHNLASGLDDYPRGMTPNLQERHLDLAIWVAELLKSLRNLSELFDFELVSHFDKQYKRLVADLSKYHFDEEKGIWNDYLGPQFKLIKMQKQKGLSRAVPPYLWRGDGRCGVEVLNPLGQPSECNPYSKEPCCSEFGWCGNTPDHCKCPKCKKSEKLEDRPEFQNKENIFNPHVGYVNLYPLFFGLIKTDDKAFRPTLNLLKNPSELYSDFGIRSLSKSDLLYHTGEDYWRGNIWLNLNFLTLKGLFKFYKHDEEAFGIYKKIRSNLIKTVFTQWISDKTFYEQYSDLNGKGVRARPFNGWTSLILNIITEKYDS